MGVETTEKLAIKILNRLLKQEADIKAQYSANAHLIDEYRRLLQSLGVRIK